MSDQDKALKTRANFLTRIGDDFLNLGVENTQYTYIDAFVISNMSRHPRHLVFSKYLETQTNPSNGKAIEIKETERPETPTHLLVFPLPRPRWWVVGGGGGGPPTLK